MSDMSPPKVQDEAALRAEITRLNKMVTALMNRAERAMNMQGSDFGLFQTTVMLERQVHDRTQALEAALAENEKINRTLQRVNAELASEQEEQRKLIRQLEATHHQLLQSEKLASIGQLAAGVAHEINNPIGFVNSNLGTLRAYADELLQLIDAYAAAEMSASEQPSPQQQRLAQLKQQTDLTFLREDIASLIAESIDGTSRVRRIVQDLRDFSRVGEVAWETVDLHAGLNSALNLIASEISTKAQVIRELGDLPPVECIPSQINQVFMNLLVNAAHAISDEGTITLRSGCIADQVWLSVSDTGSGIAPEHLARIFDPFFTTKRIGQGTGLGLSVAYGIVDKHGGHIDVDSQPGQGSTFTIWLPLRRAV